MSGLGLALLLDGKGTQTGTFDTGSFGALLGGCPTSASIRNLVLQRHTHGLGSLVLGRTLGDTFVQGDKPCLECREFGLGGSGTSLALLGLFTRGAETFAGGLVLACEPIGFARGLCEFSFETQLRVACLRHCAAGVGLGLLDGSASLGRVDEACRDGVARTRIVAHLLFDSREVALAFQRATSRIAGTEGDTSIGVEAATIGEYADSALHGEQICGTIDQQHAVEETRWNVSDQLDTRTKRHAGPLGLTSREAVETEQSGAFERIVGQQVDGIARDTRDSLGGTPREHGCDRSLDAGLWSNLVCHQGDAAIAKAHKGTIQTIPACNRLAQFVETRL